MSNTEIMGPLFWTLAGSMFLAILVAFVSSWMKNVPGTWEEILENRKPKREDRLSDSQKLVRNCFTKKRSEEMEALLKKYKGEEHPYDCTSSIP